MTEYVLGQIIARERGWLQQARDQVSKSWHIVHSPEAVPPYRLLSELHIAVLGMGQIGSEVARGCKALGMRVSGLVRRVPDETNRIPGVMYRQTHELPLLLSSADYVCNVLPSTPSTVRRDSRLVLSVLSLLYQHNFSLRPGRAARRGGNEIMSREECRVYKRR